MFKKLYLIFLCGHYKKTYQDLNICGYNFRDVIESSKDLIRF